MGSKKKVNISGMQALQMIYPYAKVRIIDQIKAVSVIVIYLILFQLLVLRIPIKTFGTILLGIVLVVIGLAFFIDGLNLGLMPLGELCGVKLPQKSPLPGILIFALLLGIGATLAEPAIGVLKAAGSSVTPWNAPLLFRLLNKDSGLLVAAVGIGVGLAVLFGMLRFLYNWSLKPFLYSIIPVLLIVSVFALFNDNLFYLTGLAWDCGGVTTGPVTVPLVLALGIGISRIVSKDGNGESGGSNGFGVVTLASAFPILTVLALGIVLLGSTPEPMEQGDFVRKSNREKIEKLFLNEDDMSIYVLKNADRWNKAKFFGGKSEMVSYLTRIQADNSLISDYFTDLTSFETWLYNSFDYETLSMVCGSDEKIAELYARITNSLASSVDAGKIVKTKFKDAIQAVLPLSIFLLIVLVVLLREKIPHNDELFLGLSFAVIGMTVFNIGIEFGLSRLGDQIGGNLPTSFKAIPVLDEKKVISNFDSDIVYEAISDDGSVHKFFYEQNGKKYTAIPFDVKSYDENLKQYTYIPIRGPLFGKTDGSILGICVVLLFAFIMGFSATLAEPALNTLGATVETITVGTFKKSLLIKAVAVGVGIGLSVGVAKIIWSVPLMYLIGVPYIILIIISAISEENFVNIAWDSAGVTTGPITVPLVLAMGLGIGGQVGVVEGFGILACASVFPILSVLLIGLYTNYKRKKALSEA